jgi:hypothetical protein
MPSSLCQEYLERAERCDRLADAAANSNAKLAYVKLAQQWRELADKADLILPSGPAAGVNDFDRRPRAPSGASKERRGLHLRKVQVRDKRK